VSPSTAAKCLAPRHVSFGRGQVPGTWARRLRPGQGAWHLDALERNGALRYGEGVTTFNVRAVKLRPGEQFRDVQSVDLEPLELGGQRYVPLPESPEAALSLTQTSSGLVFELELEVRVLGPCVRCLADAGVSLHVASREYQATSPGEADELSTPYLVEGRLDLSAWAHDAVALALPDKILCREDCAGLCPICGRDLNREPHEHEDETTDPRWAALAELRDRL
jgi:uncharacterized protein